MACVRYMSIENCEKQMNGKKICILWYVLVSCEIQFAHAYVRAQSQLRDVRAKSNLKRVRCTCVWHFLGCAIAHLHTLVHFLCYFQDFSRWLLCLFIYFLKSKTLLWCKLPKETLKNLHAISAGANAVKFWQIHTRACDVRVAKKWSVRACVRSARKSVATHSWLF